ncbi:hypothetical protein D1007_35919 [Hordeum vulgare]|nr:hypothetical protein D1007_35919 [Hordeum vulgare]
MAAIPLAARVERHFTILAKVDTHIRKSDLSVVCNNDPVVDENSINIIEEILDEDDKHKVVGFSIEYTHGHAGCDRELIVDQLCMHYHIVIYHYCMARRPCKRFARFVNNPDYRFTKLDTTNDLHVLKT